MKDEESVPRRPKPQLTNAFIASIRAPGIFRDGPGGIPGLLIRAGKVARTWELRSERPPRFTKSLGRWDDPFNPMKEAAARAQAHDILAKHRRGQSIEEPDAEAITVEQGWARYIEDLRRRGKSEGSVKALEYSLARFPDRVRKKTLRELSANPKIAAGEWARISVEVGKPAAMVTMRHLRSVYIYVKRRYDESLPERRPTVDVAIKDVEPKNAHAHAPHELAGWNARRLKLKNEILREAWLFGLLSGLRRDNLRALRWDMWDRESSVMKMTQKGKKQFLLVLSTPMIECLHRAHEAGERLYRHQAQAWVFPSGQGKTGHVIVLGGDLDAPHALRRTFASIALGVEGIRDRDVDWLLGHSKKKDFATLAPYNVDRARLEEFRHKQEAISARIMALIGSA